MKKILMFAVAAWVVVIGINEVNSDTPPRSRPAFFEMMNGSTAYRLVAVTPPYLWLQMAVHEEKGSGPIYVCKYKTERPWEVGQRCDLVQESKEDFGK